MGETSKIQWTGATWNPWHGCKKVSAGCKFCYMYRDKERYGLDPSIVKRAVERTFNQPLRMKPKIIFTCSWSDFFIEEADQWRADAWEIIRKTPQHIYQILTKRPERIKQCLPADWGEGYPNVWLGVSVEDQKAADERIPVLVEVPATIRFLSCEPLLGPIDFTIQEPELGATYNFLSGVFSGNNDGPGNHIDWVIVGGESGNDAGKYLYRECRLEWIEEIIRQCESAKVPVFVKQLGTHLAKELKLKDRAGGKIEEWPDVFRKRQMPI